MGATFLASTKLEVTSSDKNIYKFVATFPTNTTADIIVRMIPNQKYTPTSEEVSAGPGGQAYNARLRHSRTDDTYQLKLEYFLPNGVLPASFGGSLQPAISQLAVVEGEVIPRVQLAKYRKTGTGYDARYVAEGGGVQTGITVALEVALKQAGQEFISAAGEFLTGKGSPLTTAASSALEVIEVLNTSVEYQGMVAELDSLEASARNPINPLTQKAYADDPNLKQSILDEINSARSDLQSSQAALYLNTEISVGSGLLGLPVLSVAMAPLTSWNSKTLKQVMRDRVRDIRNMVTTGTGSLKPKPGSGGTEDTGGAGYIKEEEGGLEVKPGTWGAAYEAVRTEIYTLAGGAITDTYTDKGTMTFTVMADGSVEGIGRGHLVFHAVVPGADGESYSDGESGYSFSVGGYVMDGKVYLSPSSVPAPLTFSVVFTPPRTAPSTSIAILPGGMLAGGKDGLKLQSGATLTENLDYNQGGIQITDHRKMTMG